MTLSSPVGHVAWYHQLRDHHRPDRIGVLLIGESPPDPAGGAKRYFYAPQLTQHDNLYRGVAEAVYGVESVATKPSTLKRLQCDGFWLIDAIQAPVNHRTKAARRAALQAGATVLVRQCLALNPEFGVIVCHGLVYDTVAPMLVSGGIKILHNEALPFPLGNWRARFVAGMRQALKDLPLR